MDEDLAGFHGTAGRNAEEDAAVLEFPEDFAGFFADLFVAVEQRAVQVGGDHGHQGLFYVHEFGLLSVVV